MYETERKLIDYIHRYAEHTTFNIRKDIDEVIKQQRKSVLPTMELERPSILTYKRAILKELRNSSYRKEFDFLNDIPFTDEELTANIVGDSMPDYRGWKITKAVTHLSKRSNIQLLDFFNKPRFEKAKYFLSGDPLDLVRAYDKIGSCITAYGSNQGMMYRYLLSPYAYIAYDSGMQSRILVFLNPKEKYAFINRTYGSNDPMLTLSLLNTLNKMGYRFVDKLWFMFENDEWHYRDSEKFQQKGLAEVFGNFMPDEEVTCYEFTPRHPEATFVGDALTGDKIEDGKVYNGSFHDAGRTCPEDYAYCDGCGEIHYIDDFMDDEYCVNCSGYRNCEECGERYHNDDIYYVEESDSALCEHCYNSYLDSQKPDEEEEVNN